MKHQDALKTVRGGVDQTMPNCIDPAVQEAQMKTRKFNDDQKKAYIGRENRKLVEKLSSIAKGLGGGSDPRAPPLAFSTTPGPFIVKRKTSSQLLSPTSAHKPVRSLNEAYRFKTQRAVDRDNACLVRRILAVGSTFDRQQEAKDFSKHTRTVQNLMRYTDRASLPQAQRSLPQLRIARPASTLPSGCRSLQGLEALFVPGELRRAGTSPGVLRDRVDDEDMLATTLPPDLLHSAEATPAGSSPQGSPPGKKAAGYSPGIAGKPKTPDSKAQSFGREDFQTERRSWLQQDVVQPADQQQPFSSDPLDQTGVAGRTGESDLPYSEDWDENSMSGTPNASGLGGLGGSSKNLGGRADSLPGPGGGTSNQLGGFGGTASSGGFAGTTASSGGFGGTAKSGGFGGFGGTAGSGGFGGTSASGGFGGAASGDFTPATIKDSQGFSGTTSSGGIGTTESRGSGFGGGGFGAVDLGPAVKAAVLVAEAALAAEADGGLGGGGFGGAGLGANGNDGGFGGGGLGANGNVGGFGGGGLGTSETAGGLGSGAGLGGDSSNAPGGFGPSGARRGGRRRLMDDL